VVSSLGVISGAFLFQVLGDIKQSKITVWTPQRFMPAIHTYTTVAPGNTVEYVCIGQGGYASMKKCFYGCDNINIKVFSFLVVK
jgi:hypothetical protein